MLLKSSSSDLEFHSYLNYWLSSYYPCSYSNSISLCVCVCVCVCELVSALEAASRHTELLLEGPETLSRELLFCCYHFYYKLHRFWSFFILFPPKALWFLRHCFPEFEFSHKCMYPPICITLWEKYLSKKEGETVSYGMRQAEECRKRIRAPVGALFLKLKKINK